VKTSRRRTGSGSRDPRLGQAATTRDGGPFPFAVCSILRKRALLDSIDTGNHAGLRDRALIGLIVYSFARIGAALGVTVEDVFTQNRRLWVRLREKGGGRHPMPCHHTLEAGRSGT